MTVQMFLTLLTAFAVVTSLAVEGLKKLIKGFKAYDVLAVIVAIIVGGCGTLIYYQLSGIPISVNNGIYAILMAFATALCAMVGYDKVVQAIQQLRGE